MDLLQTDKNELLHNFEQILSHMEEPVLVVNPMYEVVYVNTAFEEMVQQPAKNILNKNYGNAVGCRYLVKDDHDCGFTYACNICGFRLSIDEVFNSKGVSANNFVRDFQVNDQIIFKQVFFKAVPIMNSGVLNVAIIITQTKQVD